MWLRHWNLVRDPFPARGGPYVATPPHDQAVARLVRAIESGDRVTSLRASAGHGKSIVLRRALALARSSGVRVAFAETPGDPVDLISQWLRALRVRVESGPAAMAWRQLRDAALLVAAQRSTLLLVVDGSGEVEQATFDRLAPLGPLIRVDRPEAIEEDATIDLPPLTRTEAAAYLATKLRLAGRDAPTFTPAAITCLHNLASGVPAALEHLAAEALREAASTSLSIVGPDSIGSTRPDRRFLALTHPFSGGEGWGSRLGFLEQTGQDGY